MQIDDLLKYTSLDDIQDMALVQEKKKISKVISFALQ